MANSWYKNEDRYSRFNAWDIGYTRPLELMPSPEQRIMLRSYHENEARHNGTPGYQSIQNSFNQTRSEHPYDMYNFQPPRRGYDFQAPRRGYKSQSRGRGSDSRHRGRGYDSWPRDRAHNLRPRDRAYIPRPRERFEGVVNERYASRREPRVFERESADRKPVIVDKTSRAGKRSRVDNNEGGSRKSVKLDRSPNRRLKVSTFTKSVRNCNRKLKVHNREYVSDSSTSSSSSSSTGCTCSSPCDDSSSSDSETKISPASPSEDPAPTTQCDMSESSPSKDTVTDDKPCVSQSPQGKALGSEETKASDEPCSSQSLVLDETAPTAQCDISQPLPSKDTVTDEKPCVSQPPRGTALVTGETKVSDDPGSSQSLALDETEPEDAVPVFKESSAIACDREVGPGVEKESIGHEKADVQIANNLQEKDRQPHLTTSTIMPSNGENPNPSLGNTLSVSGCSETTDPTAFVNITDLQPNLQACMENGSGHYTYNDISFPDGIYGQETTQLFEGLIALQQQPLYPVHTNYTIENMGFPNSTGEHQQTLYTHTQGYNSQRILEQQTVQGQVPQTSLVQAFVSADYNGYMNTPQPVMHEVFSDTILPQFKVANPYQEPTLNPSQENEAPAARGTVTSDKLLNTVTEMVLCSTCKNMFNRAVICEGYLIERNRPIQCECQCVTCTLCYRDGQPCRLCKLKPKNGLVSNTANTLASCPDLENVGAWDLERDSTDLFKTKEEINRCVQQILTQDRPLSDEDLEHVFEILVQDEKESMSFKYWSDKSMPMNMAGRYTCIAHVPGFWDHVIVASHAPQTTEDMLGHDDYLPKLFGVELGCYKFHWCCFVLKKMIILAMWCTDEPDNVQSRVVPLFDTSLRSCTDSPEFKQMVFYLRQWFTAQYTSPVRELKVVLDCKPSQGSTFVHFLAYLASKIGIRCVTPNVSQVKTKHDMNYHLNRKAADTIFAEPSVPEGSSVNIVDEYAHRNNKKANAVSVQCVNTELYRDIS